MAGFIVATFKPASPPLAPTPEAVWEGFLLTGVNIAYSVPAFLEVMFMCLPFQSRHVANLMRRSIAMGQGSRKGNHHEEHARSGGCIKSIRANALA